ncbi:MAG TPA: PEGA domain-containing protein, partial [Spirochaetia bacterium]|nr:PEGA domain-containing protein [Spirochaetia bacterium]
GNGLSSDNEYLLQGIPLLLVQTISGLTTHHFDSAELSGYRKYLLSAAIADAQSKINGLFQTRSRILFQTADPTSALKTSTENIDKAEERLHFLQGLNPESISVTTDKPIELVKGSNGEALIGSATVSPAQTAKELKLDLIVWGTIDQVEDYLVVRISAYDAATGLSLFDYKKTLSPSNVLNSASEVSDQLVKGVLGRDFGSLSLEVSPGSALVYLDGTFYGIGGGEIRYLTTGTHRIELQAPGYASQSIATIVQPFQTATQKVTLESLARPVVAVSSFPEGADVYVASEWKGKTPVMVDLPSSDQALVVRLSGYHDFTTTINGGSRVPIKVHLTPDIFKSQDYIAALRSRFYTGFGAFALSMIAPVSSYSLMQDNLLKLETTTSALEVGRLKNEISVWYYAYLGGAFISSALFANMIIEIFDYLRAIQ